MVANREGVVDSREEAVTSREGAVHGLENTATHFSDGPIIARGPIGIYGNHIGGPPMRPVSFHVLTLAFIE